MENRLILSKQGFYDDISYFNGDIITKESYVNTFKAVMDILTEKGLNKETILYYPERFFPNNMSQYFWKLIKNLVADGFVFDIKTSDVISICFIPVSGETIGIDNKYAEGVDRELDNLIWLGKGKGYGHNWTHVLSRIAY